MGDHGFGLPFLAIQFATRSEARALVGVELLASAAPSFAKVAAERNRAQPDVAKLFLGLPMET